MSSYCSMFCVCVCVLQGREGGSGCYATLVALVSCHHDIAIDAPVGPPAVFDEPVIFPPVSPVANQQHSVAQSGARAMRDVQHTPTVELEGAVTGIHISADGSHSCQG